MSQRKSLDQQTLAQFTGSTHFYRHGLVREVLYRAEVHQADFDSPLVKPKVNSIDSPGVVQAQKSGIVGGKCVHPGNLRHSRLENDRQEPRYSPKNRKLSVTSAIKS